MSSDAMSYREQSDRPKTSPDTLREFPDVRHSARDILHQIFAIVTPRSVLDLGGGEGDWLDAAAALGVDDLWRVESPFFKARPPAQAVRSIEATVLDRFSFERRFDMLIALEIAGKLPPARAETFVADLCRASDLIMFSASVPLEDDKSQNQRWPEFWASLFAREGYSCHDLFGRQPSLSNQAGHFKQNAFLYARVSSEAAEKLAPWTTNGMRLAHYEPDIVFSILAKADPALAPLVAQARRQYAADLDLVAKAPGSGFVEPCEKPQRLLRDELAHAQNLVAIERRGGVLIGEREGFRRGQDDERRHSETELAQIRDQHAAEIDGLRREVSDLEEKLDHAYGLVAGMRKAFFLHSKRRRDRLIGFFLPRSLKVWWDERRHRRQVAIIRESRLFDIAYYLSANPDVGPSGLEPIEHYLSFGAAEGRNPSPDFDTDAYLAEHPRLGLWGVNPFVHYIQTRRAS